MYRLYAATENGPLNILIIPLFTVALSFLFLCKHSIIQYRDQIVIIYRVSPHRCHFVALSKASYSDHVLMLRLGDKGTIIYLLSNMPY